MDDEFDFTVEELDELERNAIAARRIRNRFDGGHEASCSGSHIRAHSEPKALFLNIKHHSEGKIATESSYDHELITAFKKVPGHEWDATNRQWTFPMETLSSLVKSVSHISHLKVQILPPLKLPEGCEHFWEFEGPKMGKRKKSDKFTITLSEEQGRIFSRAPYHIAYKTACQSISGRIWDPTARAWSFPRSELEAAVVILQSIPGLETWLDARPPLQLPATAHCQEPQIVTEKGHGAADMPAGQDPPSASCKVFLYPHNSTHIAARFGYHPVLFRSMQGVPCAQWQEGERLWSFPIRAYDEMLKLMRSTPGVQVSTLESLVKRAMEASSAQPDDSGLMQSLPASLEEKLLPFQREGIKYALLRGGRALIADEMGLGKTLQALCIALCYRREWPVLVISPSSLKLHWAMAIRQWLADIIEPDDITIVLPSAMRLREGFRVVKSSGQTGIHVSSLFCVVSYDAVAKLSPSCQFKVVIADEAHYLKNPQAKRTCSTLPFIKRASRAILLTGTPALSRPIELFKLLESLYPKVYHSFKEYGQRYCQPASGNTAQFGRFRGCSHGEELHSLVKATVMVRRRKADVLPQLPAKRRQQVVLELSPQSIAVVKALFAQLDGMKKQMKGLEDGSSMNLEQNVLINKIYLESAIAKIKSVQEYLGTLLEADCKFIVFSHHQVLMDAIEDKVKAHAPFIRIDGRTPSAARPDLVAQFQENDNVRVAILSMNAAGVGLTLTAASTVVFAEMAWTPGVLVQAEDRAHRIGQVDSVNVVYLHARETIDDLIWETVGRKLENLGQVMDGHEEVLEVQETRHRSMPNRQQTLLQCSGVQVEVKHSTC